MTKRKKTVLPTLEELKILDKKDGTDKLKEEMRLEKERLEAERLKELEELEKLEAAETETDEDNEEK